MTSRRRQQFAWCLFDFANSAFNTVVVTFVYSTFFATTLVGGKDRGDALWGYMMTVSGLAIAVLAPFVGARADACAHKRRWLVALSLVVVGCALALAWPAPDPALGHGAPAAIWTALCLMGLANVAFELVFVFYNAFLPQLAAPNEIGRLSGRGWACGYLGGLLCLVLCLGFVGVGGYGPWVSTEGAFNVRVTSVVVACWFLAFALPMFALVRDETPPASVVPQPVLRSVLATVRSLPSRPSLLWFLVAHLVYNDALMALIGLAGIYMAVTVQMTTAEIMLTAIGLNVLAGAGALVFGKMDDRVGPRAVILISLALLFAGAALAIAVPTKEAFWVAASLVGIGMGPNQSASRTLLARLAEGGRSAEYFGLFALSGKATVWLAPFLWSVVIDATGSQRVALLPLLAMFAIGAALMLGVRTQTLPAASA